MEQRIVLMTAALLVTLAVLFPPAYSQETDLLMATLFVAALVCSLGRFVKSADLSSAGTRTGRPSSRG